MAAAQVMVLLQSRFMHSSRRLFCLGDCRVGKGARHTLSAWAKSCARRAHAATLPQRFCPPYGASDGFEGEARSFAHDGAEAGEIEMGARDGELVGGDAVEHAPARG